jgi:hypothetical protein
MAGPIVPSVTHTGEGAVAFVQPQQTLLLLLLLLPLLPLLAAHQLARAR